MHLLLLKAPLGQLDLVREEVAAAENVPQPELGPKRAEALGGVRVALVRMVALDLDHEVVVGVAVEAFEAVGADLLLPVDVGHRGADVVGVELLVGDDMIEADHELVVDEPKRAVLAGVGAIFGSGVVEDEPLVVLVAMGVQGDLLLCAAGHRRCKTQRQSDPRFEPAG
jgi:hypothetical protein